MKENNNRECFIVGFIITVITFVLLFIGVKFILSNELFLQNIVAFITLSIVFGGVSTILCFFKLKIVLPIFLVGIAIGFIEMYRVFINGLGGWADLVGLISLFTWTIIGLVAGLVVQLIYYIYKKIKD